MNVLVSLAAKRSLGSTLRNSHYSVSLRPDFFAPALVAIPVGFILASTFQVNALAYMVSLVSLGLLTSFDFRKGPSRTALAFLVSILGLLYVIEASTVGQALSLAQYPALVLAAFPPSLGVVLSTLLFSQKTHYRIPKLGVLASVATGIGLGMAALSRTGTELSPISILLSSLVFVPLALAANGGQMVLLHFLERFWQSKKVVFSMMPSLFFSINSLTVLAYFNTQDMGLLLTFLSSLGILPLLSLTGWGVYKFVGKGPLPQSSSSPGQLTITVAGDHQLKQGHLQNLKISTISGGKPREVSSVTAVIQGPNGKRDSLKLTRKGTGSFVGSYLPRLPGTYTVVVDGTAKDRSNSHRSFSFAVQQPPSRSTPASLSPSKSAPRARLVLPKFRIGQPSNPSSPPPRTTSSQPLPRPPPPIPVQAPKLSSPPVRATIGSLPRLDDWEPRVWLNQDVHGYRVIEHVATGATGYVLRASFGSAGAEMALKIPIIRTSTGVTSLNETMAEATTLLELSGQSKYIVQIKGILVDRLNVQEIIKGDTQLYLHSPPTIVMEFMRGGNAKRLVEDPAYDALYYSEKWPSVVVMIVEMIATALETVHDAGFVHLDVKPQNILFNSKPPATGSDMLEQMTAGSLLPKLADLGSAVRTGGKVIQFTSEYAAVEQVLGAGANPSMDIYALGATLYSLLTKTPVHSKRLIDAMNNLITNPESNRASDELKSTWKNFEPDYGRIDAKFAAVVPILRDMMSKESKKRPEASSVSESLRKIAGKW